MKRVSELTSPMLVPPADCGNSYPARTPNYPPENNNLMDRRRDMPSSVEGIIYRRRSVDKKMQVTPQQRIANCPNIFQISEARPQGGSTYVWKFTILS